MDALWPARITCRRGKPSTRAPTKLGKMDSVRYSRALLCPQGGATVCVSPDDTHRDRPSATRHGSPLSCDARSIGKAGAMLLQPVRISRPDLRQEVHAVVDLVMEADHARALPLTELVRMLGVQVAPGFRRQLAERGNLILDEDRFINDGPSIRRKVRLVGIELQLEIAPELSGVLVRNDDRVQLRFASGSSVRFSKLMLRLELKSLHMDRDGIRVDFGRRGQVFVDVS